ncbi:hypothetical protein E2C01_062118 [Portunus trituberculatus]|uniref:Uncharacterized protein n=1 Tax=Portunus trituberculatus TaxID=210409 RepID=A0A5B7H5L9_PORTR|nr:hypothetical protein [Portunus trituberculatus]
MKCEMVVLVDRDPLIVGHDERLKNEEFLNRPRLFAAPFLHQSRGHQHPFYGASTLLLLYNG